MPAIEITGAGDADPGVIRDVADGQPVSIGPGALAAVGRQRAEALGRWPTGGWCTA